MRGVLRGALLLLVVALAGCAPEGPPFASVAGMLPPVPSGEARIFIYRWLEPYETLSWTEAFLNGQPIGATHPGTVLYRDVPQGVYTISVHSDGAYPNQFKTVTLKPGNVIYVRVESISSWSVCGGGKGGGSGEGCWSTFVVQIVDPQTAGAEMSRLPLIPG